MLSSGVLDGGCLNLLSSPAFIDKVVLIFRRLTPLGSSGTIWKASEYAGLSTPRNQAPEPSKTYVPTYFSIFFTPAN
jgi:hypothetical protein